MIRLILIFFLLQATINFCQAKTYGDSTVHAEFDAVCTDSLFVVYFNKSALDSRSLSPGNNRPYNIKFYGQASNGSCSTNGTSTTDINIHYTAPVPGSLTNGTVYIGTNLTENMCGINIIASAENIIYNTTIVVTYGENPTPAILREEYDYYNVMCLMNRSVEQQLEGSKVVVIYRAPGKESQNKTTNIPLKLSVTDIDGQNKTNYKVGEYLKFVLDFESTRNVKAVIQSCQATSDGSANEYSLVYNKCKTEAGTSWMSMPQAKKSEFKTEAFRYLVGGGSVYVQCFVRVCLTSEDSPECTLCNNTRKRRDVGSNSMMTSRSVDDSAGDIALVQSKGFYIIEDDRELSTNSNQSEGSESSTILSGTNGLIIIVLLSLIIFLIVSVVIKRFFFTASSRKMTFSNGSGKDNQMLESL